jgi:hypothetical protein
MKFLLSKYDKAPGILLGLALLLIVLGIGNTTYGGNKAAHYGSVVLAVERDLNKPQKPVFPLINPTVSLDREQQHLQRIRGSLHFYIFVRRAGIIMVLVGLVLVLPSIFYLPNKPLDDTLKSKPPI